MHIGSSHRTVGIRILVLCNLQGLQGKVLRIARLVKDRFPHQDAGMVAVATDDVAGVLVHLLVPALVFVPILPTRGSHDDKESQFIAGIHERRVLRIVSRADDGEASITQAFGIAPLLRVGKGIAHIGEVLMTVGAYQLVVAAAVEVEARWRTIGSSGRAIGSSGRAIGSGGRTIGSGGGTIGSGGRAIGSGGRAIGSGGRTMELEGADANAGDAAIQAGLALLDMGGDAI